MTASASLVPLAPKMNFSTSTSSHMNSTSKTLAPLLRPQALLYYPEVILRAGLTESLASSVSLAPAISSTNPFTSSAASHQHLPLLQQQLRQLQKQNQAAASAVAQDIIGMGIYIPQPVTSAQSSSGSALPRLTPVPARPSLTPRLAPKTFNSSSNGNAHKAHKMTCIGRPLMAPPRLARAIVTNTKSSRTTTTTTTKRVLESPGLTSLAPPPSKRLCCREPRRVSAANSSNSSPVPPTKKALSSDELDFVEAAKRLSAISSPATSPKPLAPPQGFLMTHRALKAPPGLPF